MAVIEGLPAALQSLGIVKEASPGAGGAPTYFLGPRSITVKDDPKKATVEGYRGSMTRVFGVQLTSITSSVEYSGDFYPDVDGFALMGILSDLTESGTAAPYTHAASLLNAAPGQPHTYSITHNFGATKANERAFCLWNSVEISFSMNGLVTIDAQASGFGGTPVTPTAATLSTVQPIAVWRGSATINGAANINVFDGSVTIKRTVDPLITLNGTTTPAGMMGDTVDVTGKLSFVVDTANTQEGVFLADTQIPIILTWTDGTGISLTLQMSLCDYTTYDLKPQGAFMAGDIEFQAIANSNDAGASGGASPCKVTLVNAVPAGIY